MFTMFKNTIRMFLKNKAQTIIILVLLVFSGFYFSLFYNTIIPIVNKFNQQKLSSNMEQFRFYPYFELSDDEMVELVEDYEIIPEDLSTLSTEDILNKYKVDLSKYSTKQAEMLSNEYNFQYDRYQSKNITEGDTLLRITPYEGIINHNIFIEGSAPQNNNEVALGVGYANANNKIIGDKIEIKGNVYNICGVYYDLGNTYVYDPNYSKTAFTEDNGKVLVTEQEYSSIDAEDNVVYFGVFNNQVDNIDSKIQSMLETEQFSFLLPSSSISNVSMFEMTLQSQVSIMYFGSFLIFLITAIFIAMFISGHIKKSKKQFGILLAMGYQKRNIISSYAYFPLMFLLFILLGTFLGYAGRFFMTNQLKRGFNFPVTSTNFQIADMVVFSTIFAVLIGIFMIFRVNKSLNKKPLDLIATKSINKKLRVSSWIRKMLSKLPFKQHIKYAFAFSSLSRFIIMICCGLISVILINLALSLYEGYNQGVKVLQDNTSFTTIVHNKEITSLSDSETYGSKFLKTSAFLRTIGERKVAKTIDVEFVDFKTVSIDFDVDSSKSGVIVPIRYKYLYDISVGDSIEIKGQRGTLNQTVIGFSELSINNTFFISNKFLPDYDDTLKAGSFNGEYLNSASSSEEYYRSISKKALVNQIVEMQQNNSTIVMLLILFSILASFFLVNVISSNNISDNIQGIMIMMMSGYKKRTISSFLLNIYSVALLIGGFIAILILPKVLKSVTIMLNTSDVGFIQITFNWITVLVSFVVIMTVYYVSLFIARSRYLGLNIRGVMSGE